MINRIKSLIFSPLINIKKILLKIESFFLTFSYVIKNYEKKQTQLFADLNLDRSKGLNLFNELKKNSKIFDRLMSSEHKVLFASLSLSNNNFKEVMEIGTFDGENALYLSKIFPSSKITTYDLDETDHYFKSSYNRKDKEIRKKFCDDRDSILKMSNNIVFKKSNSLNLTFSEKKFDLIWIDGAHGYPFVTIDIINSLRLLNNHGYLICDDVWKSSPLIQDEMYNSIATYETLNALKNCQLIEFQLIYKRLDKINNSNKRLRKYIAIVKKIN